jgi:hypothetical protein
MPAYFPLQELAWANTGVMADIAVYPQNDIPIALPGYLYGLVNQETPPETPREESVSRSALALRVREFNGRWAVETLWPASPSDLGEPQDFSNGVTLSASAELSGQTPGAVAVVLTWQVADPVEEVVFIHLIDQGGEIVGQADGPPLGGAYPFTVWSSGECRPEVRLLPLPPGYLADQLAVRIGLYHPVTGARVPLASGVEYIIIPVEEAG